jgi:hypothetical protein
MNDDTSGTSVFGRATSLIKKGISTPWETRLNEAIRPLPVIDTRAFNQSVEELERDRNPKTNWKI